MGLRSTVRNDRGAKSQIDRGTKKKFRRVVHPDWAAKKFRRKVSTGKIERRSLREKRRFAMTNPTGACRSPRHVRWARGWKKNKMREDILS